MQGKSVLVTGGAGFIGAHVAKEICRLGATVRILDNFSSGSRQALGEFQRHVEFQEGDIRNSIACRNACRGVDTVFHLAAFISAPGSVRDPVTADSVNIGGTLNLLMAARDAGVRKVVFSSSAAVYGNAANPPVTEQALPEPETPYGLEKLYGEHQCRMFSNLYQIQTVALRYFNVYGPGQKPESEYAAVIPKFLSAVIQNQRPTVFGDGLQTRDFLHVSDVVQANILAAASGLSGEVFNVAGGSETSLLQILEIIQKISGAKKLKPIFSPPRPGDVNRSFADISKARELLKFCPQIDIEMGLRDTIPYLKDLLATQI